MLVRIKLSELTNNPEFVSKIRKYELKKIIIEPFLLPLIYTYYKNNTKSIHIIIQIIQNIQII